ncbi:T-cell immunoglobulin and mucin domain-containing protein 4-like isoform X2 [Myxocyprinus asiaticus]|uniref:T-cell immunoglobulin and mucin domain-containing protein 4-like isoform X2 n=1 Tax=Myxocyprinus asiaticus TaxID=70543 RepID=UPI002222B85A|nr:T-cell immunoglobulin and mucin domain-containing protein 4-like isoform X2 [Myxocyprinus asiaticus]
MKDLHRWLFPSWLLCYLMICKCSNIIVQNFEGENATLPCKYDSQYHGKCHICWMRGDIPNMGCGDEIIGGNGDTVVRRQSQKYQMTGEIQHGDVSLTILNITKQDSGKYGCRIHVPGWFNDEMHYVHLIVSDAPTPATWETTSIISSFYERETTGVFTTAMTEETDDFNGSSSVKKGESVNTSAVIVPVLLLLLAFVVIAALLIWKQKRKSRALVEIAQNSENSVIYNNSGSSLGLYNREMAVDNVYQIQTENEYEQWH